MRVETFRTILVPAAVVGECRALAASFPGGAGMFVVPVYTADAITHYISTGHIDKAVADALDNPAAFAEQVGADVEQVTALRAAMIVSTDQHDVVLAERGFEPDAYSSGGSMNPAIALILTLLAIILVVAQVRFGSISKAWRYLRRPERKVAKQGIVAFMGAGILVGLLSLAFCRDADAAELKWAQYSYLYLGVDYPMLNRPSPQCWDDGPDNKTTSNGGITLNGFTYGPLHVNAKYTHHSCAFNSDRNLYDAAGVEVIWYFFDRRR